MVGQSLCWQGLIQKEKVDMMLRKVPRLQFYPKKLKCKEDPRLWKWSPNMLCITFFIFSFLCSHYVTVIIKKLKLWLLVFSFYLRFLKTTKYVHMVGVFDSIRLWKRRDVIECNVLRDSHVHSQKIQTLHKLGSRIGWAHSLLSLAFTTWWNQKHPSYISIQLLMKFHPAALLWRADYMRCLKLLTSWVRFWL